MTSRRGKTLAYDKEKGGYRRTPTEDYAFGVEGILTASYRVASIAAASPVQTATGVVALGPRPDVPLAHLLQPRDDGRLGWHWDPRLLSEFIPGTESLQAPIEQACRELDVPVLLVSGGRSDLVTDRTVGHFLELAPHARHVQLPQATHMVAGDDNSAFTDTLLHFLHDLPAPTAAHGDPR